MNKNQAALAAILEKGGKRALRVWASIPRTTVSGHLRGQIPTLLHAVTYERLFRLRPRDWYTDATKGGVQ